MTALVSLALTGCGGGDADGGDAGSTSVPTATVTVTETVTAAPSQSPASNAPNVGDRALRVGQWREGSGFRSRVAEFVQPVDAALPSYLVGDSSAEGAVARVELCVRRSEPESLSGSVWDLFGAHDEAGGQYTRAGSSWDAWPPLPQFPAELNLAPGKCANGWILFNTPPDTTITTVTLDDGDETAAEWQTE